MKKQDLIEEYDRMWMGIALELAALRAGRTSPNPPVGAVIVKGKRLQGTGVHEYCGGPHAEILAINSAGRKCRGATLYVTLEPCSTRGRTGPCTDAIISSGISRVVVCVRDPNPAHMGRGIKILGRAGIKVTLGTREEEGYELIRPFSKWITTGKPYLTLKMGMSIDGRTGDFSGKSKWITSDTSREEVRSIRNHVDAILVGAGTALSDNPSLLADSTDGHQPFRIVVAGKRKLPEKLKMFSDKFSERTIVALPRPCAPKESRFFARKSVRVLNVEASSGMVLLPKLMRSLGKLGILHVLCEGGGELANSLVEKKLVDEYLFFMAPMILGGIKSVPSFGGKGWSLSKAPRLRIESCEGVGEDLLVRAFPKTGGRQ